MNKTEFTNCLLQPALTDSAEPAGIEEIIREFPYFQTAHLLLARCLHSHDSIYFQRQLKQAAARIPDRSVLYWFINNTFTETQSTTTVETVITEQPSEPAHQTVEPAAEQPDNTTVDQKKENAAEPVIIITEALEKEVVPVASDTPVIEQEHQMESEPDVSDEDATDPATGKNEVITDEPAGDKKKFLIDKFIREEPRISAPKKDFFNPLNVAQQSDTESFEIVSETLAIIYAQQGKTAHAIKIYNQLCLIFPEKSSYFAAQINKLNESIQP